MLRFGRLFAIVLASATSTLCACDRREAAPSAVRSAPSGKTDRVIGNTAGVVTLGDTVLEELHSPDGRATLLRVHGWEDGDDGRELIERVVLVAGGDSSEVFGWESSKELSLEWLTNDVGRIWLPIGGNYHHIEIYVEASSGRVSPDFDTPAAVDLAARTLVTYDIRAFTLRDLWSGRRLGSWTPTDPDPQTLWEQCDPTVTLTGRAARVAFDCGAGRVERAMEW